MPKECTIKVGLDTTDLDIALEKMSKLKSLLQEVKELVGSLNLNTD